MKNHSTLIPLLHAVGLTTRKARGEAAEAAFLAKAASLGFGIAKPWGDSERYDFILDSGYNLWRVQTKSTERCADSRYQVKTSGWRAAYTARDIDFLIAYITPENLWYIVPIAAIASRAHLRFYPHGGKKAQLEKYREAWCQLACPRHEDGASQVLVPRLCHPADLHHKRCSLCG